MIWSVGCGVLYCFNQDKNNDIFSLPTDFRFMSVGSENKYVKEHNKQTNKGILG
jgi:hypothetical protein